MDSILELMKEVGSTVAQTSKSVGSVVAERAKDAKGLAKDTVEIASTKNQISAANDIIKSSYEALGEYYYKKYTGAELDSDETPELVVNSIRAIDNAKKLIAQYEQRIEDIRAAQTGRTSSDVVDTTAETVTESIDDELAQVKETVNDSNDNSEE